MKLPPPGFKQPIPDPSEDELSYQEFCDMLARPSTLKPIWGYIRGVRIIEDRR